MITFQIPGNKFETSFLHYTTQIAPGQMGKHANFHSYVSINGYFSYVLQCQYQASKTVMLVKFHVINFYLVILCKQYYCRQLSIFTDLRY